MPFSHKTRSSTFISTAVPRRSIADLKSPKSWRFFCLLITSSTFSWNECMFFLEILECHFVWTTNSIDLWHHASVDRPIFISLYVLIPYIIWAFHNLHGSVENVYYFAFIQKINQRSALIKRCFLSRNATTLLRAHKTYVRLTLEYASTTWSPSYIAQIIQIESVQRHFTKIINGHRHLSYERPTQIIKITKPWTPPPHCRFNYVLQYHTRSFMHRVIIILHPQSQHNFTWSPLPSIRPSS